MTSNRRQFLSWIPISMGGSWVASSGYLASALESLHKLLRPNPINVLGGDTNQGAGALEPARAAYELHFGTVQSLIAVEMQVDMLKRQARERSNPLAPELERIQALLREEVLKLRDLMQEMKLLEVDSRNLLRFLADTVERFQRETGISAQFVSELDDVAMPQHVCRQLVRNVQEGLLNMRRHRNTQRVLVRLSSDKERWQLTIEDDRQRRRAILIDAASEGFQWDDLT